MRVELRDFVSRTILDVLGGVADAQEDEAVDETGAGVAVATPGSAGRRLLDRVVEFDVAVTAQAGTETGGGIGIWVGPVVLGSDGRSTQRNDVVSRVRFSVPVRLPDQRRVTREPVDS